MSKNRVLWTSLVAIIAVGNIGAAHATNRVENSDKDLVIENASFEDKTAKSGGAIYNTGDITLVGVRPDENSKISVISFKQNGATGHGGAINNDDASAVITFQKAKTTAENANDKVVFSGNSAGDKDNASDGGAIINAGTINADDVIVSFAGNTASRNGGAVYNNGALILGSGASFSKNNADKNGGAVFNNGTLTMDSGAWFNENFAKEYGGAIYNNGKSLTLDKATFSYNTAGVAGGALVTTRRATGADAANAQIDGTTFIGNRAVAEGGAIWAGDAMTIKDSNFVRNSVTGTVYTGDGYIEDYEGGGAIFVGSRANVNIAGGKFIGNSSGTVGGAIATRSNSVGESSLDISNSTFTGNSARIAGGALYIASADENVTLGGNNTFSGNTVAGRPNDIHNNGTLTITDGKTFIDGGITGDGSLIVDTDAVLSISNARIEQGLINFANGNIQLNLGDVNNYGRLVADSIVAGNVTVNRIATAGDYHVMEADDIDSSNLSVELGAGADVLFDTDINDGVLSVSVRDASDIASVVGVDETDGAILGAFARNAKYGALSLAVQEVLVSDKNAAETIANENSKLMPSAAPIMHVVSSQLQSQIMNMAATRMTGDFDEKYNAWVRGVYNTSSFKDGFDAKMTGLAAGLDFKLGQRFSLGLGYSYNQTDVDAVNNAIDVNSHNLFAYAQYKPSKWYLNMVAHYTMSDYTDRTNAYGVTLDSKYSANSFGAQVATGYAFGFGVTPELGLRYMQITGDKYNNGIADIEIGNASFITALLGLQYGYTFNTQTHWRLRPVARVAATYDVVSDWAASAVRFAGIAPIDIDVATLDPFGGEVGLALMAVHNNLELSIGYSLNVRSDYTSHTGMLKFKHAF